MTALEYARQMLTDVAQQSGELRHRDYATLLQAAALVALAEAFTRIADELERQSS